MNTPTTNLPEEAQAQGPHGSPSHSGKALHSRKSRLAVAVVASVAFLLSGCGPKKKDPESGPSTLSGKDALTFFSVRLADDSPGGFSLPNVQQELMKVSLRNSGKDVMTISQLSFSIATEPSGKNDSIGTCTVVVDGIPLGQVQSPWAVNFYTVNVPSVWPGEALTLSLVADSSRVKPGMKLVPSLTLVNGGRPLNSPITGHRLEY